MNGVGWKLRVISTDLEGSSFGGELWQDELWEVAGAAREQGLTHLGVVGGLVSHCPSLPQPPPREAHNPLFPHLAPGLCEERRAV